MPVAAAPNLLASVRSEAQSAPESGIVEVFNYGRDRQGLIPLWVGEGDLPTPEFITQAAARSLADGETFYTAQRGHPDLRAAIAAYMSQHYATPFANGAGGFAPERFFVTAGGMHALQIAMRMAAGPGDEVIVLTPAWPNFAASAGISGATPIEVPLQFVDGPPARWQLDLERLAAAITPTTRAIIVNTPANPTGWMATHADLEAILALARQYSLWIVADEIYGRFTHGGPRAPSFHDVIEPGDCVLFAQTLSKNWAMTGWRVGWLEAPPELGQIVENLIQYSTSGIALFAQRGAIAALKSGEEFFSQQAARVHQSRDVLCDALAALPGLRFAVPDGAFYLFLALANAQADSRALAFQLVDEAGIGLAPGTAFGAGGAPFMRLCFARSPEAMSDVAARIRRWITR